MLMRVGLATWSGLSDLSVDDRLLADALRAEGAEALPAVWDDPDTAWQSFDAVVVRSTWDYHKRIGEFRAWIDRLDNLGVNLLNPAAVLRRNIHKQYLRELFEKGVRVVPTVLFDRLERELVIEEMKRHRWERAVIKPAVSATAYRTAVVESGSEVALPDIEGEVLLQPFVDEILADGEWSLVFIDGGFTHAVRKRARAGDFRVQNDFGGSIEPAVPPTRLIDDAGKLLEGAGDLLYARVDGVERDGHLLLMELELTEPALFFASAPTSAAAMARAVMRRLSHAR
jgi:glutathione synthase/RimK-type ligase-like ATP-grasp enzyme